MVDGEKCFKQITHVRWVVRIFYKIADNLMLNSDNVLK